jgi:hypothetical protein
MQIGKRTGFIPYRFADFKVDIKVRAHSAGVRFRVEILISSPEGSSNGDEMPVNCTIKPLLADL